MSDETQRHGEWVAVENERRTKAYHGNALTALYDSYTPKPDDLLEKLEKQEARQREWRQKYNI